MVQKQEPPQQFHHMDGDSITASSEEEMNIPRTRDYFIFIWFCLVCFLMGCPLLNANACLKLWKMSHLFATECEGGDVVDCEAQLETMKTALILFQTSSAATSIMGGVIVDVFSPSMCMLIAHIMFGGGAYFMKSRTVRSISMGCCLQGVAGELLLNSILPICGIFGYHQNIMLVILTVVSDLSILVYPIFIKFFAPIATTPATEHEEFYIAVHQHYIYFSAVAGILGTFLLPYEDAGGSPFGVSAMVGSSSGGKHDRNKEKSIKTSNETRTIVGNRPTNEPPLWDKRLTYQIRTPYFIIIFVIFTLTLFRNSFYLTNNQQLLEAVGDDGTLTEVRHRWAKQFFHLMMQNDV